VDAIFTAHNVRLDDGTQTFPAHVSMEFHETFRAARRTLNVIYGGNLKGRSIADIGCLEGGYTTEFARLGMDATGIEVRDSNFKNCQFLKSRTNLPNLQFIQDDAMNIGKQDMFDGLFVCGVLYHFDKPRKFLEDAAKVCRKFIIVDTHVAPRLHEQAVDIFKLSGLETNEGQSGRWYPEYDDTQVEKLDQMRWTSWSNNKSFWLEKSALLQTLKDVGFDMVYEQFDCEADIVAEYSTGVRAATSRVFVVGIKTDVPTQPLA
jgi:SAM-dependent methyltransferase